MWKDFNTLKVSVKFFDKIIMKNGNGFGEQCFSKGI